MMEMFCVLTVSCQYPDRDIVLCFVRCFHWGKLDKSYKDIFLTIACKYTIKLNTEV